MDSSVELRAKVYGKFESIRVYVYEIFRKVKPYWVACDDLSMSKVQRKKV